MRIKTLAPASVLALTAIAVSGQVAASSSRSTVPVTADNFNRAESDMYFAETVKLAGGVGKFHHYREFMPVDKQPVVRPNRDTLYSTALFDLDAGPVTVTMPDAGSRFMSLMAIDEDQYDHGVYYGQGEHTFTRDQIGTRYVNLALRILIDPSDPEDIKQVHALQDAIRVDQPGGPGKFEPTNWDPISRKRVRDALLVLGSTLPDSLHMFGSRMEVDPVRHLIGTAMAFGGNPEKEALYLNVTPQRNDGVAFYRLNVKDVPVDGFWSISVYNAKGYFQPNRLGAYSLNNITAKKSADGSIDVQFGGCDGKIPNCLPIMPGWNYMVRLYRPHEEILNGSWTFPAAEPLGGVGIRKG